MLYRKFNFSHSSSFFDGGVGTGTGTLLTHEYPTVNFFDTLTLLQVPDDGPECPDGRISLAAGRQPQVVPRVLEPHQRLRPHHHPALCLITEVVPLGQVVKGLGRVPELCVGAQGFTPDAGQAGRQKGEGGGREAAPLIQHL